MKFRWCTLRFIPRLNHCVSYLWFFMVPKSIRQAKLDQIRSFRASAAFRSNRWIEPLIRPLLVHCIIRRHYIDIPTTDWPLWLLCCRFWGEILYQDEIVKSHKIENLEMGYWEAFGCQYFMYPCRGSISDTQVDRNFMWLPQRPKSCIRIRDKFCWNWYRN